MSFLVFVKEYWFVIILAIAVIAEISITLYKWFKKPTEEQIAKVQEWLLYAVAKAEQVLGSGTGQLKLRYVYNMFVTKFPGIALFISFEEFSKMVDKALNKFEDLLKNNKSISAIYMWDNLDEEKEDGGQDE